jgi:hypothetical protein
MSIYRLLFQKVSAYIANEKKYSCIISWGEQVTFQWDDDVHFVIDQHDDVHFVIDQHA